MLFLGPQCRLPWPQASRCPRGQPEPPRPPLMLCSHPQPTGICLVVQAELGPRGGVAQMEVPGQGDVRGWGHWPACDLHPSSTACLPSATPWRPPSTTMKPACSTAAMCLARTWSAPACRPTRPCVPRRASAWTGGTTQAGPAVSALLAHPRLSGNPGGGGGPGRLKTGRANPCGAGPSPPGSGQHEGQRPRSACVGWGPVWEGLGGGQWGWGGSPGAAL